MEDTEWFGPISRIEIVEQSDGLLFRVIQIKRRGHLALGILVTVVFGVLFAWQESWLFFFALGLGLVWIGAWCFDDHWGEIQVDGNYLTTRGKKPVRLGWERYTVWSIAWVVRTIRPDFMFDWVGGSGAV